jgi:predicted nucleic acid-binding protein
MSSRVLISVLCVGAVAFACGPRARNEVSTAKNADNPNAQPTSIVVALQQQGSALTVTKKKKSPVSAHVAVRKEQENLRFAFRVVNTSKKRVEITFPSGQTYDFVVLDSTGREMWRWGADRMFTQALRNKLLGAGETLDYEETLKSTPLPPGRYTARATLTSANYPLVEETAFVVTGTTLASR